MQPNLDLSFANAKCLFTIKLQDVRILVKLNSWLPETPPNEEQDNEPDTVDYIRTSTKMQLMYLALMSVVVEEGVQKGDRFTHNHHFRPLEELQEITASGQPEKENEFDTLGAMLKRVYRKITTTFRYRLQQLEDNYQTFWFYRNIFLAARSLLQQFSRLEYRHLHTKSLLTLLLKQQDSGTLIQEFKHFAGAMV